MTFFNKIMSVNEKAGYEEFVLIEDDLNACISDHILSEEPQSVMDEKHVQEVTILSQNRVKDTLSVESMDDQDTMEKIQISENKEEILEDVYKKKENYIYETDSFTINFFTRTMKDDIQRMENNLLQMKRQLNHVENTIFYAHSSGYFEAMTDYLDYIMKRNYNNVFHKMYDYVTNHVKSFA